MPWVNGLSRPVAAVMGGYHWKSLEKNRTQPERQLLLLAPPIRLVAPLPLICFFDGTKREIIINFLPCQLIQTEVEGYWTEALNTEDCQPNII